MKFIIKIAIICFSWGCVTSSQVDQSLNTWIGVDADELVGVWGAPRGSFEKKDGAKILTFERSGVVTSGTDRFARAYSRHCQINFSVDKTNKIISFKWNGHSGECDRYIQTNPTSPTE